MNKEQYDMQTKVLALKDRLKTEREKLAHKHIMEEIKLAGKLGVSFVARKER